FFFQAEDGIRDGHVTGVQTCALPICRLSSRIRKEAHEAHQRRREVERLYSFSRQLLGEGNVIQLMNAIPDYLVESFEAGAAELFLPQKDKFYRSGFGAAHLNEKKMKIAFLNDELAVDAERAEY